MGEKLDRKGMLVVLSSPSGAGKSSICQRLLALDSTLALSVSATTRPPRSGEEDGKHYHFLSAEAFDNLRRREALLEHAYVFEHHYGTPREPVLKMLQGGYDVLFDVDWNGARQLREQMPDEYVGIFILPPSLEVLRGRLERRSQDSPEVIARRMNMAVREISHWQEYDWALVNEDLEATVAQVRTILASERLRRRRQVDLVGTVEGMMSR